MWLHASGRDVRLKGGGLFPPNEAPKALEATSAYCGLAGAGWGWDGDWMWASRKRWGTRGPCCQTGSSCTERGPPSVVGGGVD